MKKWSQAVAATAIITTLASPLSLSIGPVRTTYAAEAGFADQNLAAKWAQEALIELKSLGIMDGDASGKFHPADQLTRQEFAAVLAKLLVLETGSVTDSSFSDVASGSWAAKSIEAVNKLGYMTGSGTSFRPEDPISREEIAVTLVRVLGVDVTGEGAKLTVADADQISGWAKDAVSYLIQQGIMEGDGKNFAPKRTAQRQEIAAIIAKTLPSFKLVGDKIVSEVHDDTVVLNGAVYTVSDSLKGLFREANSAVLRGARVQFVASGREITRITSLELTSNGQPAGTGQPEFSGNLNLDGKQATIEGDLKVSGDYLSVTNVHVAGNFQISSAVQHDFYSDNLRVGGTSEVNGGDSNTVVFNDAALNQLTVNKPNVHVETKGQSTVGDVTFTTNATLTADSGIKLPKVTLSDDAKQVQLNADVGTLDLAGQSGHSIAGTLNADLVTLSGKGAVSLNVNGTVTKLDVQGSESAVTLSEGVKIGTLSLPSNVQASTAITNYSAVQSNIGQISGGVQVVVGGGGSAPADTTPVIAATAVYGNQLTEYSAGTEAVFDLVYKKGSTVVDAPESSLLAVTAGGEALVPEIDYTLDEGQLILSMDYLNELPVGTTKLSLKDGKFTGSMNLTVYAMNNELKQAIEQFNTATDAEEAFEILTSFDLGIELTPFSYLPLSKQAETVGLLISPDYKGEGYLNRAAIQDTLDDLVYGFQMNGTVEDAVAAVNNAATVDEMLDAIQSPILHLDHTDYTSLEDYELEILANYLIAQRGAGYADRGAIQDKFASKIDEILEYWYRTYYDVLIALDEVFAPGDSETGVTQNLNMPVEGYYGSTIEWESSNPAVIATDGTVTRPEADTVVTLTVTANYGYEHYTFSGDVLVKAAE